ncbi:MAG: hypothetical protein R3208_14450 [Ketobacteraceae bacterium]|nr:hypothetical protein [Ketobacteraceae bacterium]
MRSSGIGVSGWRAFLSVNRTLLVVWLLLAGSAYALPPEIEVDRLILAAREKLAQQDYPAAREYLERVAPLGVEPPADYYLLYGRVYYDADAWEKAKQHFETYVEMAGKEGEAYKESLAMITELEEILAARPEQTQAPEDHGGAAIQLAEKQGLQYDRKVAELYLDPSLTASLVTHINSLLKSYRYIDGKIKNIDRNDYIDFKLSLTGNRELMLTRRDVTHDASGPKAELSVSRLSAFGIDPSIEYRCSKESDSCTIKHPLNQKEWIKIARDEDGAEEISKALTRLLKALQRG